jgi:hypothetical protein
MQTPAMSKAELRKNLNDAIADIQTLAARLAERQPIAEQRRRRAR